MLMTTTSNLDGQPIRQYLGVVNGEAIIGANLFKDMFASIRNVVGGRAGSYERTLADARRIAMEEMEEDAKKLGANRGDRHRRRLRSSRRRQRHADWCASAGPR
jgi:Uncharacterized conserved protein